MDDYPSPERQRALARCKSWLAKVIAESLYIRTNTINMAYFSRLFSRWNTLVCRNTAYNPNIHLEPWQRQNLLVRARLSCILIARFLKPGELQLRYPNKFYRAILSRFIIEDKKPECTCVAILERHRSSVSSVAFHPTLPLLATGSLDKTAKLWRLSADGTAATCVATLEGHSYWVNSVAFHPTALLLATGSADHTVKLWRFESDGSSTTCVATLVGHSGYVNSVAFHPTAPLLAIGFGNNTVKLLR